MGSISSALVIGVILLALNRAGTVYTSAGKYLPRLERPVEREQSCDRNMPPATPRPIMSGRPGRALPKKGCRKANTWWTTSGQPKYFVDPAINGIVKQRDNGTPVQKFNAPKTALMALLTEGILTQKLSWTLVLMGVAIAVVLELSGVPSLPFAVGVYLPLAVVDADLRGRTGALSVPTAARRTRDGRPPSEAESEMGPGVLLSTGYIAGGAIAGVLVAFLSFYEQITAKRLEPGSSATRPSPWPSPWTTSMPGLAARRVGPRRAHASEGPGSSEMWPS